MCPGHAPQQPFRIGRAGAGAGVLAEQPAHDDPDLVAVPDGPVQLGEQELVVRSDLAVGLEQADCLQPASSVSLERERQNVEKERDKREEALRQQLEALRAIERGILDREERLRRNPGAKP